MNIYVHTHDGVAIVSTTSDKTVDEIIAAHGGAGHALWIEGSEEPTRPGATLAEVGLGEGGHVHVTKCGRITVTASYNVSDKTRTFPPATVARAVLEWALGPQGFDLPADQRIVHTIIVCGGTTLLDLDEHIGVFAGDTCVVCVELVPTKRFEG
jgi:hypothetical protein